MNIIKSFSTGLFFIMCSSLAQAALQNNGDGTITDISSNLMWQRCTAPSKEVNCTQTPLVYTWDNALEYCNTLSLGGHTNWRLPNIKAYTQFLIRKKI